jgi:DUF4097 and DUF4098 domain-containing protein YvlB
MDHVFETPGAVALRVTNPAGLIEVQVVDGTQTTVEVTPLRGGEAAAEAAEETTVEAREVGDGHRIIIEAPRSRLRLRDVSLAIRVRVPAGASLDANSASADVVTYGALGEVGVKTASGDVTVERAAAAQVKTASGDVALGEVGGKASVSTASGDVRIEQLEGPGQVRLVSGDLTVADVRGSLHATTVSGDQDLQAVERGELRFESVSGDVTVGVRRGVGVWMDVHTLSGSMRSELEVGERPPAEAAAATLEVRGKTVSGDVVVRRAPARETSSLPTT